MWKFEVVEFEMSEFEIIAPPVAGECDHKART
jgi:hypothetical protein